MPANLALPLHREARVSNAETSFPERRREPSGPDRRRHSRSGRRSSDPHVSTWHWRRIAWLFGAYVTYVSVRTLPTTIRKIFRSTTPSAS